MKFSGHETFPLRQGWLHKGMKMLQEHPDRWKDEYIADWLGVGNNMAKSIRHWMLSTELAETAGTTLLQPSAFGRLVLDKDPFFLDEGTWWMLHANLAVNKDRVTTWYWFFNHFSLPRFDKAVCLTLLRQYLEYSGVRMPSVATLDRDILCLLASYAKIVPYDRHDPEDSKESPFTELGLLTHFRFSGSYEINHERKHVPPHILGYILAKSFPSSRDISLSSAATAECSPGRICALSSEALFEELTDAERALDGELHVRGMAGERQVILKDLTLLQWAREHYHSSVKRGRPPAKLILVEA